MASVPPKSENRDAIEIVNRFMEQNPLYEVDYSILEEGSEYLKALQYCYTMGDRTLALGDASAQKQDAKRSAAQKTVSKLRSEGYKLW